MKQKLLLAATFLALLAGVVLSEWQRAEAPVRPDALLYWVADTQHELTRLPMASSRISDKEEIVAGKELAKNHLQFLKAPSGPEAVAIQEYIRTVGGHLSIRAKRKLPFEIYYVPNQDFVNAFALPGGPVFIGGGLVALMDTEDELAAVLGHEIEHIDHYHCAERLQWELALRKLPLGNVFRIPAEVFQVGYSKEQELEADREGVALALAVGYSPAGAVRVFEEFERLRGEVEGKARTPGGEISEVTRDILRGYFRSHPPPRDRIEQIRRIYGRQLEAAAPGRPLQFQYVYIRERAARLLDQARQETDSRRAQDLYREAAALASRSLQQKPYQASAVRILATAQLGLGDFEAASTSYRKLVALEPQAADAIRKFADELAGRTLAAKEYDRAVGLVRFSLDLQPNQPHALKILALAQLGLGNFDAARETARQLDNLYPDAGKELAGELQQQAAALSINGEVSKATRLLSLSLELEPSRATRLSLADAQFTLGDFTAAAANYRSLLLQAEPDLQIAGSWADALATEGDHRQAAAEFRSWAERTRFPDATSTTQARIELAGLLLVAGDETLAKSLVDQATASAHAGMAPEHLARLGWWYTRAGHGQEAAIFLRTATQMRPTDFGLQNSLGWAEWESGQREQALQHFEVALALRQTDTFPLGNTPRVGRMLVNFSRNQSDAAIQEFEDIAKALPALNSLTWVQAIYPARSAETLDDLLAARTAEAEFNRANFSLARSQLRSLVEKHPGDPGLFRRYADALSTLTPSEGVAEFQAFLGRVSPTGPEAIQQVQLDLAGLKLLAGDSAECERVLSERSGLGLRGFGTPAIARLAWWHFRTGSSSASMETVLRAGLHLHPKDALIRNAQAWYYLEKGSLRLALEAFQEDRFHDYPLGNTAAIGRAIALWRLGPAERRLALATFESTVKELPQWLNPKWVEALYPSHVIATVSELQDEYTKKQNEKSGRKIGGD